MRRTLFSSAVALVGVVAVVVIAAAGGAQAKKPALSATPVFKLHLKPSQEVPPVKKLKADAVGSVTFDLERSPAGITSGEVIFYFNYSFPESVNITGLHIHQAPKGSEVPTFVVDSGVASFVDSDGKGNVTTVVTGVAAGTLQAILTNPRNYYVNLHTSAYLDGALRDQMHNPKKR
jgi:hypothetical protein